MTAPPEGPLSTHPVDANALLEALGIGVFSVDHRTGRLLSANDAFARLWGYASPEEAIGSSVFDHYSDPKERDEAAARFLRDPAVLERGYLRLEAQRLPRGSDVPVAVLLTVLLRFDDDGAIVRLDCTAENIDERKQAEKAFQQSEERFRLVFSESAIGMAITESAGRLLRVNEAFCRLTGRSEEELLDLQAPALLHPDEDPGLLRHPPAEQETGELRFLRPDGTIAWGYVNVSWLRDDEGSAHSAVLMVQDVTERRRNEAALARVERLESLSVLAGGLAHDFNNLLTGIVGNLSLAESQAADRPDLCRVLRRAARAGEQAGEITRQLVTFAKGGTPMGEAVALGKSLEEGTRFCLHGSSVEPIFYIARDLWLVDSDVDQTGQVVHNLVLNAKQAMPQGGTIHVAARNKTLDEATPLPLPPGRYVEITIADNGVGIPAEHLEKIFDPYFSTKSGGSGLGLASVHSIVRKHGGHVAVTSSDTQGTTFTIYLPASTVEPRGESAAEDDTPVPAAGFTGRILVMDDEPVVRKVAAALLQDLGHQVDAAPDGESAVTAYAQALREGRRFDAVILDLTVPGAMGGTQALQELKQLDPNVRAIVSSGYSDDPAVQNFRQHGFLAAIAKPYTLQQLTSVVRRVLPTT